MILELRDLTKHYGTHCALNHVSYLFERGVYGILGANGAGKSTLMSLLTDTLERESGQILYDGMEILELGSAFRRKVGYMPQEQGFYAKMAVGEFLMYMAQIKEIPRRQARRQIPDLLKLVHLEECSHKSMESLSGGMRQRALLAQALLGTPEVVILDEPTAGLDPWERKRLCRYIWKIGENSIVFLASHIVSDIEETADCVLLMEKGQLVCDGTVEELLAQFQTNTLEEVFLLFMGKGEKSAE